MARRDPSSLTSAPVILHYGGTGLSVAIAPALSSYPKLQLESNPCPSRKIALAGERDLRQALKIIRKYRKELALVLGNG
jgi:hypothetical protein